MGSFERSELKVGYTHFVYGKDNWLMHVFILNFPFRAKCENFYNYLETVLGPVARSFNANYDVYEAVQENKA